MGCQHPNGALGKEYTHIRTDGIWFKDERGRSLLLHGANLGGSSKLPSRPDGATYRRDGFFEHRDVSFVGRPFPLEQADQHFGRLRAWGLTFLRLLTTWEAIEHAGPGQYDEAYLAYLRAIAEKAAEYEIQCFIDFAPATSVEGEPIQEYLQRHYTDLQIAIENHDSPPAVCSERTCEMS